MTSGLLGIRATIQMCQSSPQFHLRNIFLPEFIPTTSSVMRVIKQRTHTHDSKTQVFPTCTDEISEVLSRNTHIVKVDVRILREVWVHVSGAVVRSHAPVIICFMLSTIGNYTWLREREVRIRLCATGSYQHIQLNCANRITCQSLHVCDLILRFMLGQLN